MTFKSLASLFADSRQPSLPMWMRPFRAALAIIRDERCAVCGTFLAGEEICPQCWLALPYTQLRGEGANPIERLFWDIPQVERASAFMHYAPDFEIAKAVHAFKYHGNKRLAKVFGRAMALDLATTDFFQDVEALVPVPLSTARSRQRGYNQSEYIAMGIASVTGIPVLSKAVRRVVDNPSQTSLSPHERKRNVENIFAIADEAALRGKCVVLVDDVITVGATLHSFSTRLSTISGIRLRLLALCAAGQYSHGRVNEADLHLPDLTAVFNPQQARRFCRT